VQTHALTLVIAAHAVPLAGSAHARQAVAVTPGLLRAASAEVSTRWLKYTPAKSDPTSGFDLVVPSSESWVIEIFSGSCTGLVSLGCCAGGPPKISLNGIANQTYVLAVGRVSGSSNPIIDLSD
jgi:hypothetical protein